MVDGEYNAIKNEIIAYLHAHDTFTKTEKNFLKQSADTPMKMDVIFILLKSILKWEFYKFCNYLKESSSERACTIGFNLIAEANKAITDRILGKKENVTF